MKMKVQVLSKAKEVNGMPEKCQNCPDLPFCMLLNILEEAMREEEAAETAELVELDC
jgi:hypothetical protein